MYENIHGCTSHFICTMISGFLNTLRSTAPFHRCRAERLAFVEHSACDRCCAFRSRRSRGGRRGLLLPTTDKYACAETAQRADFWWQAVLCFMSSCKPQVLTLPGRGRSVIAGWMIRGRRSYIICTSCPPRCTSPMSVAPSPCICRNSTSARLCSRGTITTMPIPILNARNISGVGTLPLS